MNQYLKNKIENKYGHYFNEIIKLRGQNYYQNNKVISCLKYKNTYFAKVQGNEDYQITITFKNNKLDMSCTCPCEFNCKHEFATLLSIFNHHYKTITLKPKIKGKTQNLKTTIKKIPAGELKKYFLTQNFPFFNQQQFEQYFFKYMPNQSYAYYYNNLYNDLILNQNYIETINQYIKEIKKQIKIRNFKETFIIIKAIINALKDTQNLDNDDIIAIYNLLELFLRITYHKANFNLKKSINSWIKYIKTNKYYDSIYLEELFLTIERSNPNA